MKKIFFIYITVFILWTAYRFLFRFPEWVDELIVKPLVFVVIPLNLSSIRKIPGFEKRGNVINDMLLGIGLAFFFAFAAIYANIQKYGVFSSQPLLPLAGGGIILYIFLSLITSFSEEVFGRGILFGSLRKYFNTLNSALISSILMMALYIPIAFTILNFSDLTYAVYFISIFLLSFVNCFIFENRKSLVLPILIHTFWNMSIALFI